MVSQEQLIKETDLWNIRLKISFETGMLIIEKEKDKSIEQILSIWSLLKKNWWYGHVLDIFNLQQNKSFIYNNKALFADDVCSVPVPI